MAKIIYLIGPRTTASKVQQRIDRQAAELLVFVDAGVQLREQLNFSCAHYSLGDGDGDAKRGATYHELLDEVYPTEKDESDLELALKFIEKKQNLTQMTHLHALGLWGGRFDHQLANMGEFLSFCETHPQMTLTWYGEQEEKAIIATGKNYFNHQGIFSLFLARENEVSIEGNIQYPLEKTRLTPFSSRGLSNIAAGKFTIEVDGPYLVVFI